MVLNYVIDEQLDALQKKTNKGSEKDIKSRKQGIRQMTIGIKRKNQVILDRN